MKEIKRMMLFNPYHQSTITENEYETKTTNFTYLFDFYKKISTNAVDLMNYTSKKENDDDVNIDIIDFNNMRVAT